MRVDSCICRGCRKGVICIPSGILGESMDHMGFQPLSTSHHSQSSHMLHATGKSPFQRFTSDHPPSSRVHSWPLCEMLEKPGVEVRLDLAPASQPSFHNPKWGKGGRGRCSRKTETIYPPSFPTIPQPSVGLGYVTHTFSWTWDRLQS